MNRSLFAVRKFVLLRRSCSSAGRQMVTNPEEIAKLYRELSLYPSLSRADVGPVITSQYGGKYSNIYTGTFALQGTIYRFKKKKCLSIAHIVVAFMSRMEPARFGEE